MGIKIKMVLIVGDKRLTQFMQACDLFEPSKVLGEMQYITIDMKPEEKYVTYAQCERLINHMAEKIPSQYNVSLIHLDSIVYDDRVMLNTKCRCKPYIDKSVRMISDGNTFYMFHYFLTKLNIPFELDEHCFIK